LEINFHIAESEWLKMDAHLIREKLNRLNDYQKKNNFQCPFVGGK